MPFTSSVKKAAHPISGEMHDVVRASVWEVEPRRGDLFVIMLPDKDVLVRLEGRSIAKTARAIYNVPMDVLVDQYGNVVALPIEDSEFFSHCIRLHME